MPQTINSFVWPSAGSTKKQRVNVKLVLVIRRIKEIFTTAFCSPLAYKSEVITLPQVLGINPGKKDKSVAYTIKLDC